MSLKGCCTSGCVEDCSSEVKEDISRKISCQNVFYVSPSVSLCLCLCTSVRWSLIQVFLRLIKNNVFWINDLYFIRIIQSVDYQRGQMFTSSLTYLVCVARSCRPSHCKLKLLCFFLLLFMLFFSSLLLNHIWHSTNAFFFKLFFIYVQLTVYFFVKVMCECPHVWHLVLLIVCFCTLSLLSPWGITQILYPKAWTFSARQPHLLR